MNKIKYFFGRKCLSASTFFKNLGQRLLTPPKPSISELFFSVEKTGFEPRILTTSRKTECGEYTQIAFLGSEMSAKERRAKHKTLDESFNELTKELGNEMESKLTSV